MGNDAQLTAKLSSAVGNLATASGSLHSAVDTFAAVAKRIEQMFQELGAREASLDQRELRVRQEETEMREQRKELERKKAEWEGIERRMEANAAKLEHVIHLDVGGQQFPTTKATLLHHKGSYFESMLLSNHSQQTTSGDFFIDRNPKYFGVVLDYLREGRFRNADFKAADAEDLEAEFDFFRVPKPAVLSRREKKTQQQELPVERRKDTERREKEVEREAERKETELRQASEREKGSWRRPEAETTAIPWRRSGEEPKRALSDRWGRDEPRREDGWNSWRSFDRFRVEDDRSGHRDEPTRREDSWKRPDRREEPRKEESHREDPART